MRQLAKIGGFVMELLRELGDENAYHRHLQAHSRVHSRKEWQRFSEERLAAKYVRPKCC